ncbi:MAG TPA: copper amine oxidase N-terminal domain-containing protein [Clostridia bacterium]
MKRSILTKGLSALLSILFLTGISTQTFAADSKSSDQIAVFLNGQKLEFADAQPYIKDGRTLVPFRAIFQAFGMQVSWDSVQKTVHAANDKTDILLTINSLSAFVNSKLRDLDVPPEITGSRTFVPLRFISSSIGAEIKWDGAAKKIIINNSTEKHTFGKIGSFTGHKFSIDKVDIDTTNKIINVSGKTSSESEPLYVFVYNSQGGFIMSKASVLNKSGDLYNYIASTTLGSNIDFNMSYVVLGTYNEQNQFVKFAEYTKD